MKKSLYILAPYPFGEAPSQRFRFEQYLDYFEKEGFEIHFHPFLNEKTWQKLYKNGSAIQKALGFFSSFLKRWVLLFKLPKADMIFIHRETAQIGPPVFEWIIAKVLRKKYIYDFDDAIWLPNYSASNARFHRLKAYWKIKFCIRWAHHISAGNDYLADYARQYNKNVTVIPTTIDTENHHNKQTDYKSLPVKIGWTGTHTTMHYIDEIIPVLQKLEKSHEFEFVVISNQAPTYDLKSLRFVPWKKETEIKDLAQFSIGVMPLRADKWSEGKCGFKGLQYMALGIPSVLSPVGVNNKIIEHGKNGFLVASQIEWEKILVDLITQPNLREKTGLTGKETVIEQYSVISQRGNYLTLINQ